jgi:hypothetical protein
MCGRGHNGWHSNWEVAKSMTPAAGGVRRPWGIDVGASVALPRMPQSRYVITHQIDRASLRRNGSDSKRPMKATRTRLCQALERRRAPLFNPAGFDTGAFLSGTCTCIPAGAGNPPNRQLLISRADSPGLQDAVSTCFCADRLAVALLDQKANHRGETRCDGVKTARALCLGLRPLARNWALLSTSSRRNCALLCPLSNRRLPFTQPQTLSPATTYSFAG